MMTTSAPKNAPKGVRMLKGPTLVRYAEATRFLWGDKDSGQVADVIYGRNEVIGALMFILRPGAYFKSSNSWKSFFNQNRYYYVLKGELTIQDPETGEVSVARAHEVVHWRGAKWHFGYNFTGEECVVLDWYAPQERPPNVTELEFGVTKPKFQSEKAGQHEYLGQWPEALATARSKALSEGGVVTLTKSDALHFIHGDEHPTRESLFVSTKDMTAGTVDLTAGARSDNRSHPSDKVIFTLSGKLHVYLPESYDWFELNEWDVLYIPANTPHQYWNYTATSSSFAFMVVPNYA